MRSHIIWNWLVIRAAIGIDTAIALSRCKCVCGGGVCLHDKMKTPDLNYLKLGILVILLNLSKPVDFGFK